LRLKEVTYINNRLSPYPPHLMLGVFHALIFPSSPHKPVWTIQKKSRRCPCGACCLIDT
jgi:hypothetical protein